MARCTGARGRPCQRVEAREYIGLISMGHETSPHLATLILTLHTPIISTQNCCFTSTLEGTRSPHPCFASPRSVGHLHHNSMEALHLVNPAACGVSHVPSLAVLTTQHWFCRCG